MVSLRTSGSDISTEVSGAGDVHTGGIGDRRIQIEVTVDVDYT